jgi:predicted metal-dependent hydrolase
VPSDALSGGTLWSGRLQFRVSLKKFYARNRLAATRILRRLHFDMHHQLTVGEKAIPLVVRTSRRARRLSLRLEAASGDIVLVLPVRASLARGLQFAAAQSAWIAAKLAHLPPAIRLADGIELPLLGQTCTVRHRPAERGAVRLDGLDIIVTGAVEHLPRRLKDWLKSRARVELAARAHVAAGRLGKSVARVSVREMHSRWGSFSARGTLGFCWRLILAPPHVVDYVVAHEVAHLVEMNHGRHFWSLVRELAPDLTTARDWLRANGNRLQRYG